MKKIVFGVFCGLVLCTSVVHAGVMDACYATRKCGARNAIQAFTTIQTATVLGSAGAIMGPVGTGLGVSRGVVIGKNLGGQMAAAYSANEYIYFPNGQCIECDTHQIGENYECPNGTIVSNGADVFKCHTTSTGDYWQSTTLYPCSDSPIQDMSAQNVTIEIKSPRGVEKTVYTGVKVYSGDACLMIDCPGSNFVYDGKTKSCEKVSAPVKPVKPTVGKCHPSVCTSEVCKACCAKPGTETIWTPSVNKCVCVNGGNFVKENNDWVCKTVTVIVPEKYKCDSVLMAKVSAWKDRCSQFSDVLTEITALEKYCAGKPDKDIFLRLYDELKDNVDNTCVKPVADDNDGNATVVIGIAKTRIQNAVSSLQLFVGGLDVSKWKDREGDFNTARLASDMTAGVVLGTAGALITSHLVKKHQVEDGFEDLQCTIGGQTVANWGDEFSVGIQ